jgi:diadenosine tetraphosphate (Ap4A) HIT family hydrolase
MKKISLLLTTLLFVAGTGSLVAKAKETRKETAKECAIKPVASCPFCQIAGGKNKHQAIKEGKNVIAIKKQRPIMYGQNFLVLPKEHYVNLIETDPKKAGELFTEMIEIVQELSAAGKREGGTGHFTLTFNNGSSSAQSVFHMHMHVTSPDSSWGF